MFTNAIKIEKTYKPGTDADAAIGTGSALWAQEALEEYSRHLAADFGISGDDIEILSLPQSEYQPGMCAGTLRVHTADPGSVSRRVEVVNLGVWDAEGRERTVKMLVPVTL
jgi:hypothetical protein